MINKQTWVTVLTIVFGCGAMAQEAWAEARANANPDWKTLDVGMIATVGIKMTSDMSGPPFTYTTGQAFTPVSAIDCTNFTPAAAEYVQALKAGATVVKIQVSASASPSVQPPLEAKPGAKSRKATLPTVPTPSPYYGVLALCKIHKSAQGPASRAYNVQVPAQFLEKARDGFVSVVGEKVAVLRSSWDTPTQRQLKFGDLFRLPTNSVQQQSGEVQEDFSWILWLTDREPTFTEAIPAAPTTPQH